MPKTTHRFRDPVHTFIEMDTWTRRLVDSAEVQRLRHIHQLAMSYLVYPGTTHTRFEHSLGVLHLSGRVFDTLCAPENLSHDPSLVDVVPELQHDQGRLERLATWKKIVRTSALLHDIGHLPFSHAAEVLLPVGWDHERLTLNHIQGVDMKELWADGPVTIDREIVAKLAIGEGKYVRWQGGEFSNWEALLSEIITGDAFGVDRMDYLLRDSLHAGVPYGVFDHHRLIDSLRIVRYAPENSDNQHDGDEKQLDIPPAIGVTYGGLRVAESLALARYAIYSQVYFHPVRRAYDIHLRDYLSATIHKQDDLTDLSHHLNTTDVEIMAAIRTSIRDSESAGYTDALRIVRRRHFKLLWQATDTLGNQGVNAGSTLTNELVKEFGEENVKHESNRRSAGRMDFPVLLGDGKVKSSLSVSTILASLPASGYDFIFIEPGLETKALRWLSEHEAAVLADSLPRED